MGFGRKENMMKSSVMKVKRDKIVLIDSGIELMKQTPVLLLLNLSLFQPFYPQNRDSLT